MDDGPVPCQLSIKDHDEKIKPSLFFSNYTAWTAHLASLPIHGALAIALGGSRLTTKRKMETDVRYHDVSLSSPPFDTIQELGVISSAAEPKFALLSPASSRSREKDKRELIGYEPKF